MISGEKWEKVEKIREKLGKVANSGEKWLTVGKSDKK